MIVVNFALRLSVNDITWQKQRIQQKENGVPEHAVSLDLPVRREGMTGGMSV